MGSSNGRGHAWTNALLVVLSPIVFLGLLEATLVILGVEPKTLAEDPFIGFASYAPLFVEDPRAGEMASLVTAPSKRGFFNLQSFPEQKSEGAYRIFTLGGSTTYGRPYDDRTSFSGWLPGPMPEEMPGRISKKHQSPASIIRSMSTVGARMLPRVSRSSPTQITPRNMSFRFEAMVISSTG